MSKGRSKRKGCGKKQRNCKKRTKFLGIPAGSAGSDMKRKGGGWDWRTTKKLRNSQKWKLTTMESIKGVNNHL